MDELEWVHRDMGACQMLGDAAAVGLLVRGLLAKGVEEDTVILK